MSAETPLVLSVKMVGACTAEVGAAAADALRAHLRRAPRPMETFWDLGDLQHYDREVRTAITDAMLKERKQLASVHTFTRSSLVRMGISVANIALGGLITAYREHGTFQKALERAIVAARASS